MPQTIKTLTYPFATITLIGTMHTCEESIKEVVQTIEDIQPQVVTIELDKKRFDAIQSPNRYADLDIIKVLRQGEALLLLANLVMNSRQKNVGNPKNIKPGSEMLAAVAKASECKAAVALIDRPLQTTLLRAWRFSSTQGKLRLISALSGGALPIPGGDSPLNQKVDPADMEKSRDPSRADALTSILSEYLPQVKQVLIDERNEYMAQKLFTLAASLPNLPCLSDSFFFPQTPSPTDATANTTNPTSPTSTTGTTGTTGTTSFAKITDTNTATDSPTTAQVANTTEAPNFSTANPTTATPMANATITPNTTNTTTFSDAARANTYDPTTDTATKITPQTSTTQDAYAASNESNLVLDESYESMKREFFGEEIEEAPSPQKAGATPLEGTTPSRKTPQIVAVMGSAHLSGVIDCLNRIASGSLKVDSDALNSLPKKSAVGKVVGFAIPLVILALIAFGFYHGGVTKGVNLALDWILWNGGLSALGALLSLANPLTILTAFVAAPFTSLCPLIGAGIVAALVQAFVCRVKVRDLESIQTDIRTLKGFYHNRLLKVILVFILSSIGSSIGTFLGGAGIIAKLLAHFH